MIALPELHNLIRSLNKPEKRFFKLLSATENHTTEKSIELFDYIEKINDKDDIYYKAGLRSELDTSPGNLKIVFDLILKSQRSYYSETITGFSLSDDMANVKILFEKAQYKQCRKMLKTVKEKAFNNEKFSYLLEIIDLEKQLLKADAFGSDYQANYNELRKQKEDIIKQERNLGIYYRLYAQLRLQIKSNSIKVADTKPGFFENFLKNEFLNDPGKALSVRALFLLFKCRALCYEGLHLHDPYLEQLTELKNFLHKNPFVFYEMPRQYIDVLFSLGKAYIEKKDYLNGKKTISEIQALLNSKKLSGLDLRVKLEAYCFNLQLLLLMFTGDFTEARNLAESIVEFIRRNEKIFNKEDKSMLLYNLTNLYIYDTDFSSAAKILKQIKAETDKNARWDHKLYSKIQELVICFEQKEFQKMALINNTLKVLVKDKQFTTTTEKKFIDCFAAFDSDKKPEEIQKKFGVLYKELSGETKHDKVKRLNFNYFNFVAYAGYKANADKLQELVIKTL